MQTQFAIGMSQLENEKKELLELINNNDKNEMESNRAIELAIKYANVTYMHNTTFLMICCWSMKWDYALWILSYSNANTINHIDDIKKTALMYVTEHIFDEKCDITVNKHSPLDVVQQLLKRGAKTNIQNELGETALHIVARNAYYEYDTDESIEIKKLIEIELIKSTNVNITNYVNETPMMISILMHTPHPNMIELIDEYMTAGTDLNISSHENDTVASMLINRLAPYVENHYYVIDMFNETIKKIINESEPLTFIQKKVLTKYQKNRIELYNKYVKEDNPKKKLRTK